MKARDEFIFDEWAELARSDAAAFEVRRSEYIQQYLDQIPEKYLERLIRLQWRLDAERKLESSPLASCIKMYSQMWGSFCGSGGLSERLNDLLHYMSFPESYFEHKSKRELQKQPGEVIYLESVRGNKINVTSLHPD